MNSKFGPKQLLSAFGICAVFYFAAFYGLEHLRARKGPWQITFTAEAGPPAIVINHPKLGIQNVKLTFPSSDVSNHTTQTLVFNETRSVPFDVPFGQCIFFDPITLPGNVTLKIFGHEIQLLPRVLTIDLEEQTWKSDAVIPLYAKP